MLRLIIALPFLIVLVLFALSNTQTVPIGFWPTDVTWQTPVSVAILAASAVFFLLGALVMWANALGQMRRARRAEAALRRVESELRDANGRLAAATAVPARPLASGRLIEGGALSPLP